jgi:putative addiction module component
MVQNSDMKQDIAEILKEALKLPSEARAALAGTLLDSLDETVDRDAELAWEAEIGTRLKEIMIRVDGLRCFILDPSPSSTAKDNRAPAQSEERSIRAESLRMLSTSLYSSAG